MSDEQIVDIVRNVQLARKQERIIARPAAAQGAAGQPPSAKRMCFWHYDLVPHQVGLRAAGNMPAPPPPLSKNNGK